MRHAKHDAADAFRLQQAQLMHGKRLAVDFEQRFRHGLRDRPKAGREAAGENRNRQQCIPLRMSHHRGSGKVELHADFAKSRVPHDSAKAGLLFCVEHEKSASAGADEFAAERAVGDRQFI